MYYNICHCIILKFHSYNLVTSEPEEGWSGQPKYCYKYTKLYEPCSSLWLLVVFTFQVWLTRSLVRSNAQSSRIFVHGFAVYLPWLVPIDHKGMANIKEVHGKPRLHASVNLLFGVWPPSPPCGRAHEQYPASYDNHEDINSWVSFSILDEYGASLSGRSSAIKVYNILAGQTSLLQV